MKKTIFLLYFLVLTSINMTAQQKIYWTHNSIGIMSANMDGTDNKVLIRNRILNLTSFDIDTVNNKVYWTDDYKRHIGRSNIDGTNFEIIKEPAPAFPSNVRVDNIGNKIYWLEKELLRLMRSNFDGTSTEPVAVNLPNGYRNFELDIKNNQMFWIDGSLNTIFKTKLDNTGRTAIALGDINIPAFNLRLDHINKRVYWATAEYNDSIKNTIKTKTFDGTDEKNIFTKRYAYGHNLEFEINPLQNTLYIKDKIESTGSSGYLIGNLDGTNLNASFGYGFNQLLEVRTPSTGVGIGTIHRMDIKNNRLYILSGGSRIYWQTFSNLQYRVQQVTKEAIISPSGIAIDKNNNKMYWTDPGNGKIQRANLDGSNIEDLVQIGNNAAYAIALDLENKHMYWTERNTNLIRRANLDGSNAQTIINTTTFNDVFPQCIALDVPNKKIYFTIQGGTGVSRSNFDGTGIENLFRGRNTTYLVNQFALDLENKKIYWSEGGQVNGIIRANLDGTQRDTFFKKTYRTDGGISLDVTNKRIYWIVDSVLQRVNYDGTNAVNLIQNMTSQLGFGGYMTWGATHSYIKGEIASKTEDLALLLDAQVFPTIFDKTIHVDFKEKTVSSTYYTIHDMTGSIIKNGFVSDNKTIENLDHLHSGIYILKLVNNNKYISTKVVKL
jgi:hypothetical protein